MAKRLKTQARAAAARRRLWPALDFAAAPVLGCDPAAPGGDVTARALVVAGGGSAPRAYPLLWARG